MKRVFKSIGTAILYFLLFFGVQFAVGIVFGIAIAVQLIVQNLASMDVASIVAEMTGTLLGYSALISMISGILTLLVLFLIFGASGKRFASEVCLNKVRLKSLPLPALLSIAMYITITMLMSMLPIPETLMDQYSAATGSLFSGNMILTVLAVVIVAPIAEEVVFRGLILSRLRRGMSPLVAAIVCSALFAVAHGYLVWMASAFLMGLALSYVCIKYHSIAASIAVHMVFNLLGVISSGLGDFEPSSSLIIILLIAGLAASTLLLIAIGRQKVTTTEPKHAQEFAQSEDQLGGPHA